LLGVALFRVLLCLSTGAAVLLGGLTSCDTSTVDRDDVTAPAGWRSFSIGDAATMAVPEDAHDAELQPFDSVFGKLEGQGYEIIYDHGRYTEGVDSYEDRPEFERSARRVDGRDGVQVSFAGDGQQWQTSRVLQVPDGPSKLTIWVNCVDDVTCQLADAVFDSVAFT